MRTKGHGLVMPKGADFGFICPGCGEGFETQPLRSDLLEQPGADSGGALHPATMRCPECGHKGLELGILADTDAARDAAREMLYKEGIVAGPGCIRACLRPRDGARAED